MLAAHLHPEISKVAPSGLRPKYDKEIATSAVNQSYARKKKDQYFSFKESLMQKRLLFAYTNESGFLSCISIGIHYLMCLPYQRLFLYADREDLELLSQRL